MTKLVKINEKSGIPLVGSIAFGVIDRGTNILQVRPTTLCNLNCIFCSTGSGINSCFHRTDYVVDVDYLLRWVKELVDFKGKNTEIHIDSVGEPTMYKNLVKLVKEIREMPNVEVISMQSNGTLLTKNKIKELEGAGLNRINLSIHSLNGVLARKLSDTGFYNVDKVVRVAREISKSKIDLLIAPVYLPGINDKDIEDIIVFAKSLNCKLGIQKYLPFKYGRRLKVKNINWYRFYNKLRNLSKKHGFNLIGDKDIKVEKRNSLPLVFKKREKVYVVIKAPGWMKGQMLGVAKNRVIMVEGCNKKINDKVRVEIVDNKNNIYLAK